MYKVKPDFVVFKYEPYLYKEASMCAKECNTKLIPWAHNFIKRSELTVLANNPLVTRIICVSKEQLNMYRDHKAFLKSVYIYNGMPVKYLKTELPYIPSYSDRPYEVTYIGSIVPYKGFHILAEAWKDVLKVFPQAKLNVIGNGKLYDRNSKLGHYGIAEEEYEKQLVRRVEVDDQEISINTAIVEPVSIMTNIMENSFTSIELALSKTFHVADFMGNYL